METPKIVKAVIVITDRISRMIRVLPLLDLKSLITSNRISLIKDFLRNS
jgi:hypothetical protein